VLRKLPPRYKYRKCSSNQPEMATLVLRIRVENRAPPTTTKQATGSARSGRVKRCASWSQEESHSDAWATGTNQTGHRSMGRWRCSNKPSVHDMAIMPSSIKPGVCAAGFWASRVDLQRMSDSPNRSSGSLMRLNVWAASIFAMQPEIMENCNQDRRLAKNGIWRIVKPPLHGREDSLCSC
jgi:hypothetical protein